MAEKLIVINETDKSLPEALEYVSEVIRQGRISNRNKSYCFATEFKDGTMVFADKNKSSDTLRVTQYKRRNNDNE